MPVISFPQPASRIGNKAFWDSHDLDVYDARITGRKPPPRPEVKTFLDRGQVRKRYGGRSVMWLWRLEYPEKAEIRRVIEDEARGRIKRKTNA